MKTNIEEINSVKKRLTVEIDAADVDKKFAEAYQIVKKNATLPGFRKGKIPQKLVEQYFSDRVQENVTKDLVNETLPKALEETKTYPINTPMIENVTIKKGETFHYTALMEVRPIFELKDYKGLELEKEIVKVTDEEVGRQLEEIRRMNGKLKNMEETYAIQPKDIAILQYEGFENGLPLPEMKADQFMFQMGNNPFPPDFEKGLIGLKAGAQTEIKIDFPKDHPHLAGKNVLFKVKVLEVKTLDLPELNNDFVQTLGADLQDVEGLKARIKEQMIAREEDRTDKELKQRLLNKIAGTVQFDLPESLVESEVEQALENLKRTLTRSGSSMEKSGLHEEHLRSEMRPGSEKRVKNFLILAEIAQKDDIRVEEKDLDESFEQMAKSMNQDPKVVRQFYESQNMVTPFRVRLLEEKTLKYLLENAKIKEVEAAKVTREE
ncbi:MAG: trigger factor [Desulfobacteraceae bacterium]|nr:MAG: trigger factor [Desulfobacteraceae bacterium]